MGSALAIFPGSNRKARPQSPGSRIDAFIGVLATQPRIDPSMKGKRQALNTLLSLLLRFLVRHLAQGDF
jgi:hypothetical protein